MIQLPTIDEMRKAAQRKLSNRRVSTKRGGYLKAGGKWNARDVARVRAINIIIADNKRKAAAAKAVAAPSASP